MPIPAQPYIDRIAQQQQQSNQQQSQSTNNIERARELGNMIRNFNDKPTRPVVGSQQGTAIQGGSNPATPATEPAATEPVAATGEAAGLGEMGEIASAAI
jgi:hypothetical protein